MQFRIYRYFEKHPFQKQFAKQWMRLGLPLPERIKRQLANQIHAEMIVRLMAPILQNGAIDLHQALATQYQLGRDIASQTADLLSIQPSDARSLSRIVDFLHGLLEISGKQVVTDSKSENLCRWTDCPLSKQLKDSKEEAGAYYCHLYQEMYKGVLFEITPQAHANTLEITQSLGKQYCEIKTWLE